MTGSAGGDRLWIVGPGRVGLSLGLLLHRAGAALVYSGRKPHPPDHPLFADPNPIAQYLPDLFAVPPDLTGVLITVPDGAVAKVAAQLAETGLPAGVPVLHASGMLGHEALAPLAERGHPTGSVHPLAAVADPVHGAERLRGATFGVEGEGAALALAERIVSACGGRAFHVQPGEKPLYHAAAVVAANYTVVLLALAERLMARAGVPAEEARAALASLAAGAVANVAERGPAAALTGPAARGDAVTVGWHLARLSAEERPLYSLLGREAVAIAEAAGLAPHKAARVRELLGGDG
ncbi:MAG TPA: Rossmann-like and DUF2520 domain-containing protein [Longimicrobiaceae bacterium]|nr:Rossmann-like and DUF2520 domain-containing protein [Longimicrobiaceae bacterium]